MAVKSLAAMASAEVKETESGLKVEYISKPDACDKVARNGDMLSMHYVGTLESGAKFDSSYNRSEPFKFQIGVGQVIKGSNGGAAQAGIESNQQPTHGGAAQAGIESN